MLFAIYLVPLADFSHCLCRNIRQSSKCVLSTYYSIVYLAKYITCNSLIYDLVPSKLLSKYDYFESIFILCQDGVVLPVVKSYINRPHICVSTPTLTV